MQSVLATQSDVAWGGWLCRKSNDVNAVCVSDTVGWLCRKSNDVNAVCVSDTVECGVGRMVVPQV